MSLDNSVLGKKVTVEEVTGRGMADRITFQSLPDDKASLAKGLGSLKFNDLCALEDDTVLEKVGQSVYEVDLTELASYTFSNGLTGAQVLEAISESLVLSRNGVFTNKAAAPVEPVETAEV